MCGDADLLAVGMTEDVVTTARAAVRQSCVSCNRLHLGDHPVARVVGHLRQQLFRIAHGEMILIPVSNRKDPKD